MTGLDLKVMTGNGKFSKKIVGLSPVSGMCDVASSCTVSEGNHFESVFVIAHELGHNLGKILLSRALLIVDSMGSFEPMDFWKLSNIYYYHSQKKEFRVQNS